MLSVVIFQKLHFQFLKLLLRHSMIIISASGIVNYHQGEQRNFERRMTKLCFSFYHEAEH